MINTFGGRWFDEDWNAQLDSPEVQRAVEFYVDLVRSHGQPGAATSGFTECATQLAQGRVAMWYDSTSAVSTLEDPSSSNVVGKIGYAAAPVMEKDPSGWLYTWSLGIPTSSENADDGWKFISWMTDQSYMHLVGEELGWERVPPGSRLSTYEIPEYKEAAQAYGPSPSNPSRRRPIGPHGRPGPLHRNPVLGDTRIPGPRHPGEPTDQRRHRRPSDRRRSARSSPEVRRSRRRNVSGGIAVTASRCLNRHRI